MTNPSNPDTNDHMTNPSNPDTNDHMRELVINIDGEICPLKQPEFNVRLEISSHTCISNVKVCVIIFLVCDMIYSLHHVGLDCKLLNQKSHL